MVDCSLQQQVLQEHGGDPIFAAHMALAGLPGAGAFLTAPPVDDGREIDAPLFQVVLKRRLRAPVFEAEFPCPMCGEIMDRWGDHALTCSCNGDRTVRHNAIRNVCYEEAVEASLRPEREKAHLFPQRPISNGLPSSNGGRRPDDVWLPRGSTGKGEALDFAVTSGLQSELVVPVADTPGLVFQRYEQFKRSYKGTASSCETQGFAFVPMVVEAHGGGWSPLARATLDWISRQQAICHNESPTAVSLRVAQRISCTLHKENARAILRRTAVVPEASFPPSGWEEQAP